MSQEFSDKLWQVIVRWLSGEPASRDIPCSDYDRLRYEIRFCDVLLVEGRSRVSSIIQSLTLSPWTHAALYIGQLHSIDDPKLRELIYRHYPAQPDEQLIIEALLGQGTIVAPLSKYRNDQVRICRPASISRKDAQAVVAYAAGKLGLEYDVRQLLDLARFFFPYRMFPRRWRSSLFGASRTAKTVCSTMLAEAFSNIRYPVRPILKRTDDGKIKIYNRNMRLYTPNDFDYSPYFEIIKYPIFGIESPETYKNLPWDRYGVVLDDEKQAIRDNFDDEPAGTQSDDTNFELARESHDMLEDVEPRRKS
jgi:hypothetical protein